MVNLSFLRHLSFEINDSCILDSIHNLCPRNSNRWEYSTSFDPITKEDVVNFATYCTNLGFKGLINFHYYNEPLCTKELMLSIVDLLPNNLFSLWTNGILLKKEDEKWLGKFTDVMITLYDGFYENIDFIYYLLSNFPNVRCQLEDFDDRKNELITPKYNPQIWHCNRPNWELVIDYYGNGHICCGDWKGELKIGNIKTMPYDEFLNNWIKVKTLTLRPWTEDTFKDIPRICQICTTRSPKISQV
jgi:hypothetical protein